MKQVEILLSLYISYNNITHIPEWYYTKYLSLYILNTYHITTHVKYITSYTHLNTQYIPKEHSILGPAIRARADRNGRIPKNYGFGHFFGEYTDWSSTCIYMHIIMCVRSIYILLSSIHRYELHLPKYMFMSVYAQYCVVYNICI